MTAQKNFLTESFITALAIKAPVRSFATTNVTLSGEQTINLVALTAGDRVLLTGQTDPLENGVWDVQISAWNRSADFDGSRDVVGGTIVPAYRASDGEIILYNVDGVTEPLIPGTDTINFSVYFDPTMLGGGEDLQATTVLGNTTDQGIEITDGGDLIIREAGGRQIRFSMTGNPAVINLEQNTGATVPAGINFTGAANEYFFNTNIRLAGNLSAQGNGSVQGLNGLATEAVRITHDDTWGRVGTISSGGPGTPLLLDSDDGTAGVFMPQIAAAASSVAAFGQFWVRNTGDGEFIFTDDAGLDQNLSASLYENGTEQVRSNLLGAAVRIALFVGDDDNGFGGGLGSIYVKERATAGVDFTSAGLGQFWVRSDADNVPMFTSDDGTDQLIDPSASEINVQNGNYTTVLADKGKTISKESGGAGETITIDSNANVPHKVGTFIAFNNDGGGDLTIAITADTLIFADDNSTGPRTLADGGYAVAQKVGTTTWKIAGKQLS